jgi:tRNA(adenine34) deaminase
MSIDDTNFMQQAMLQAAKAIANGELPFGAVVVNPSNAVLGVGPQMTKTHVTFHAEIVAMTLASIARGGNLQECTLYSTVEPCAMCSFIARQYEIKRVVIGLRSPLMGGYSQWPILQDQALNRSELGFVNMQFAEPPEVVFDCCTKEVWDQWYQWNAVAAVAMEVGGVLKGIE